MKSLLTRASKWTLSLFSLSSAQAASLKVGDRAPSFRLQTHEGQEFNLESRAGHWTVLYFYPKANTPGCTKQACAFRDNIQKIRDQGADLFGISTDTVAKLAAFHKQQNLNFVLLADPEAQTTKLFDAKIPGLNLSRRWTFVVGPDLKIRSIEKDVDPALDAQRVARQIEGFKKQAH